MKQKTQKKYREDGSIEEENEETNYSEKKESNVPAEPEKSWSGKIWSWVWDWIWVIALLVGVSILVLGVPMTMKIVGFIRGSTKKAAEGMATVIEKLIKEDNGIDGSVVKKYMKEEIDKKERKLIRSLTEK